jgi:hypothetical protein
VEAQGWQWEAHGWEVGRYRGWAARGAQGPSGEAKGGLEGRTGMDGGLGTGVEEGIGTGVGGRRAASIP